MNSNHIYNSFKDFILFLYIHMASVDGHFDSKEEEVIFKKLKRLFPKSNNYKEKYEEFKLDYNTLSHEEVDTLIQNNFNNFSHVSFSDKYRVYREMYDIINADGVVDDSETQTIEKLKKIIDHEMKNK